MTQYHLSVPEGHFIFKNKPNAQGERSIYLRYYIHGEYVMNSTGISLNPIDWDSRKEQVKSRNLQCGRLNARLKSIKDKMTTLIEAHNQPFTPDIIRTMMAGNFITEEQKVVGERSQDFIQYAIDFIQSSYDLEKLAYSTYKNDIHNIEMFRSYIAQTTGEIVLPIKELSVDTFDKYKKHCLSIGNKKQSINKKLKPLFKAVEYASKNEVLSTKTASNICDGYFDLKTRRYEATIEDSDVNYLTSDQLQEFVNLYPTVKHDRTREFIDMFMFCYYACGLRFSDLLTLEWSHIDFENREINKNLYKGKVPHNIPLTDGAIEILNRWKEYDYNKRFIFDLLPEYFDLDDAPNLDKQRLSKNRSLQTSLNELGKKIETGLSFNLSIHVARHSYAVYALNNGVSLHMVSRLLGHSSITTTEKVYAKFLPATVAEEVLSKTNRVYTPMSA